MQPGSVSVVLVNFRSADDTLTAIDGLRALDWPADALQVIVVDNASGDGSAAAIAAGAPEVELVASETNLGFAGGCNLGVAHATGEFVALLNNDARPHPQWIAAAVAELRADARIGCVASKVLDWEGETIDFAAAAMGFDGQGYKLHVGRSADEAGFDQPDDVLFASGAALVMPTAVYRELGGFDERYFMFFEDVDLGWRLWLRGYRVRYVPTSVAFHKHHATMKRYGNWYERFLLNRNALFTIYKNYGDANLARALPATLLLTVRRGSALGHVDRHALDLERGPELDDVEQVPVSKQFLAAVHAIDAFTEELPSLQATRDQIQATRVTSDQELTRLFRLPFHGNISDPDYLAALEAVVAAFEVREVFSERRRIVIATSDALTERMAGPAIRAWTMAKALAKEHEVRLVTETLCEVTHPDFSTAVATADDWPELEAWCDVIVFQGFLLNKQPFLVRSEKVIVVDIYDPFHLEQLELFRSQPMALRSTIIADAVRVLNEQIRRGDFFLCASEKQRDFWLGQLSAMQRVNPYVYDADESLQDLLAVVPFGVTDEPPVRTGPGPKGTVPGIGSNDKVIIWGGGIYNWFDPLTLIRAVDVVRHQVPEVRLYFMGTKHPNPDVAEMRVAWEARELAEELGLLGSHVFFNDGWVPYDERQNHLLDAVIGVSTHFDHVETAFSFRTRLLDYFWASLPVVSTAGDTLAELIEQRGLGLTVPSEDVNALAEALLRLLTDDALAAECRANVEVVADEYRWSNVLAPLVEFCRHARRAPDARHLEPVAQPVGVADLLLGALRRKLSAARAAQREGGATLVARKAVGWARRRARPAA